MADDEPVAVLADVLARDRRSNDPAFVHAPTGREYDYRRFLTTAWKAGLFLRNEGVRGGMTVAVAGDSAPETVLSFLGAGLLGATVEFEPATVGERTKALVAPTPRLEAFGAGPRTRLVGYGSEPDDPSVAYWERDVWSENPTMPPDRVGSEDALLRADGREYTHGNVVAAARRVAERYGIDAGTEVVVRGPLTDPGVVAAGVVAPLVGGGVVVVPDGDTVGDVAVGAGPEPRTVAPEDVF